MHSDSSNNFLLLYKLVIGSDPYQPTKTHTNAKIFTPDPLFTKNNYEFVIDKTIHGPIENAFIETKLDSM